MAVDPYVVLRDYWRWGQFVKPAPRYLSSLLCVVCSWVASGSETAQRAVSKSITTSRSLVESELRQQPEFSSLLEACLQLVALRSPVPRNHMDSRSEALVIQYERLAKSVAWKVWCTAPAHLELDELVGIANAGLVMAAARWNAYCLENKFNPDHVQ